MAKRLTDTEIWDQDWYIDLPNKYKLMWNYVKDKCDNVGIWRPNISILQKIIGEPLNVQEFHRFLNIDKERIRILPTGRWWIKDFFVFQYGNTYSPTSQVHRGALKALVSNGVHPNEIMNLDIGIMQKADIQVVKQIAYEKDINKTKETFGIPINRDINKSISKDKYKSKSKEYNTLEGSSKKGEKFDEDFEFIIFSDGTSQPLGKDQKEMAKNGQIEPETILKGSIY